MSFTVSPPISGTTLQLYKYEPFSYTITYPTPNTPVGDTVTTTVTLTGTSFLLQSLIDITSSTTQATFANTNGFSTNSLSGEPLSITVQYSYFNGSNPDGSDTFTYSLLVYIGNGRFVTPINNSTYTFYLNETVTPIVFTTVSTMTNVYSTISLPPGLYFSPVDSNTFNLQGTPAVQIPTSNYLIVGQNTNSSSVDYGKVVTTNVKIGVSGERINLTPIVYSNTLTIGTPIASQNFTATFPTYGIFSFFYSWSNALPDGLYFTDNTGAPLSSNYRSYAPPNAPYRIGIAGTPTVTAAYQYANSNYSSNIHVSCVLSRNNSNVSNAFDVTLPFSETVLFNNIFVPTIYSGVAVPSTKIFDVATYFSNVSSIATLSNINLNNGTLAINQVGSNCYISGTPASNANVTYTFNATNTDLITQSLNLPIPVISDLVTFNYSITPSNGTSYSFINSRPLNEGLTGYYPSQIKFNASSGSGNAITYSISGFPGNCGIVIDSSTGILSGIPNSNFSSTPLTITAVANNTNASNTTVINAAILADTITSYNSNTLQFVQNRPFSPYQIISTTLSGRNILSYTATSGLLTGLTLTNTGLIKETPLPSTSGTLHINASTGYNNLSISFPYTTTPDSILFTVDSNVYALTPGNAIPPIPIHGLSYSGTPVGNFTISNNVPSDPTYGITIGSSTGILGGTLYDGIPTLTYPSNLLPYQTTLKVSGTAGLLSNSISPELITTNPVVPRKFISFNTPSNGGRPTGYLSNSDDFYNWSLFSNFIVGAYITDLRVRRTTGFINSMVNTYIIPFGSNYAYSTNGVDFTTIATNTGYGIYKLFNEGSTWYSAGTRLLVGCNVAVIQKSTDDGLTWSVVNSNVVDSTHSQELLPRNDSNAFSILSNNYYLTNGVAFDGNGSNFMIGGFFSNNYYHPTSNNHSMLRSSNYGSNWDIVTGEFLKETANFNLSGSVWIATGSDSNFTGKLTTNAVLCHTIKYSTDQGLTWSNSSGDFNVNAYDITYANGVWMVTGTDQGSGIYLKSGLRYSTNGSNWNLVTQSDIVYSNAYNTAPNIGIGPVQFDDIKNEWNLIVRSYSSGSNYMKLYVHDTVSSFDSNWVYKSTIYSNAGYDEDRIDYANISIASYTSQGTISSQLVFPALNSPGGPVFVSPSKTEYILYQYMPLQPIQITATGTGIVYLFLLNSSLPQGLSFDPTTGQITGTPTKENQRGSFTIYAKDDVGISTLTISYQVLIPNFIKQQNGAGAFTSLVRQTVEVNAAEYSVNNEVYPAGVTTLGSFMSPAAPDNTKDKLPCNC